MKKTAKKLKVAQETLRQLDCCVLENAAGGVTKDSFFCPDTWYQCSTNCGI